MGIFRKIFRRTMKNNLSSSYTKDEPLNINSLKNTLFNLFKETPKDEDKVYATLLGDLRNRGIVNTNQLEQIIRKHWEKALKPEQPSNSVFFSHCALVRSALEIEFDEKSKKAQEELFGVRRGKEVYDMFKRTCEKAKKCGGDPFYEYRKRKILPEKFEYGMNCFFDRFVESHGEELVQNAYEELKKIPNSYELDEYPRPGYDIICDSKEIPVLFGVTLDAGIKAINNASRIINHEKEFIPHLNEDYTKWSVREVFYVGDSLYNIELARALDDVERKLWIIRTSYIKGVLGEEKFCRWLIETKVPESLAYYEENEKKSELMVGSLIAALRDENEKVRERAAHIIGTIGEPAAVPLIRALKDENKDVQANAAVAVALGKIGEPAVVPLIRALKDENEDVQVGAAVAFIKIGEPAVVPLIRALKDENSVVRMLAVFALGEIGDVRAVEPLSQALADENKDVQANAQIALGKIGEPAVEPLIRALKDENEDVRVRATHALGEIGEPAVEPLIQALKDENEDARVRATHALGEIGEPAVEPLIRALKHKNSVVRMLAVFALGEIGDVRVVEPLSQALADEDETVRKVAKEALEKVKAEKS